MIEDTSRESSSRIALEEQRHRHKISNTNSNFYKFRQQQEQLQNIMNERPKSSKGGLRSSINQTTNQHHQSQPVLEVSKPSQTKQAKVSDRVKSVDGKSIGGNKQQSQLKARKDARPLSSNQQSKATRGSDKNGQRLGQIHSSSVVHTMDEASSPLKDLASLDKKLIQHLMPTPHHLKLQQSASQDTLAVSSDKQMVKDTNLQQQQILAS